jgi:hypothetical protein
MMHVAGQAKSRLDHIMRGGLIMTKNVGTVDRAIRAILGIALIAWALTGTGQYAWLGWIGVVPLFTAAIGWCPPYSLLGINTCGVKRA